MLELIDEAIPESVADEILVKMKTFSLNRADALFHQGYYLVSPRFPSPIGIEGAGVIHLWGKKITKLKKGDRVSISPAFNFSKYGVLSESAVVPKDAVIKLPGDI